MNPNESLILSNRDARGVVTLTLHRPDQFNALSEALMAELQRQLDAIAGDESVRVVVLAASGKAFCAGHDLKEMRATPSTGYYQQLFQQCGKLMLSLQMLPVPVVARVQGTATAAGCQLVATCDLAVAASSAKFAVSGVNLGLFCSTPAVALSRNLGRKAAFEMLVTGDFISADQALHEGLINRVVEPDALPAEALALAQRLAAGPTRALGQLRRLLRGSVERDLPAQLAAEEAAFQACAATADFREGVDAFFARRKPAFQGR